MVDRRSEEFEKVDVLDAKGMILLLKVEPLGSWCAELDDCGGWRSLSVSDGGSTTMEMGGCVPLDVEAEGDSAAMVCAAAEGVDDDVDAVGRSEAGTANVLLSPAFDLDGTLTW